MGNSIRAGQRSNSLTRAGLALILPKKENRVLNKKSKICLIGLNSAWYQSTPSLYILRENLRGLPYSINLLEFTLSEPLFDILTRVYREKPDIACFSAYIWNSSVVFELARELKKVLPGVKTVLGGPEAGRGEAFPEVFDFIVKGPGEGAIRKLAEAGFSLSTGVYELPAPHLRELPFPYRRADKSTLQNKLVYYESSRGCPYHCAYCLSALDDRNEARFNPDSATDRKKLFQELDALLALQPRTLKFVDRSFNAQPRLARLIWDYAIKNPARCEYHFEIYPELISEEDLRILERVPPQRIRFEIGIQTIDAAVARACGRASNWAKAKSILNALRERTQICVHADLLAGLPGEKYSSVLRSVDELASTFPAEIQLGMLKILPETPMLQIARERGYIWQGSPPWQVLATDALSFEQMAKLQELAKIINLYWNKGEFVQEWKTMLKAGEKASKLFLELLKQHHKLDLQLHSISKTQRAELFATLER
ncbi:MAG: DUF4080 domain-containing protein [Candidatus Cloacimonetes bacterium]|nr:DUF4080 domain-containing protein [Candidatus Cloacimonadota bacterium]